MMRRLAMVALFLAPAAGAVRSADTPAKAPEKPKGTFEVSHKEASGRGDAKATSLTLTMNPRQSVTFSGFAGIQERPDGEALTLRTGVNLGGALSVTGGYVRDRGVAGGESEKSEVRLRLRLNARSSLQTEMLESKRPEDGASRYALAYRYADRERLSVSVDAAMAGRETPAGGDEQDIEASITVKGSF